MNKLHTHIAASSGATIANDGELHYNGWHCHVVILRSPEDIVSMEHDCINKVVLPLVSTVFLPAVGIAWGNIHESLQKLKKDCLGAILYWDESSRFPAFGFLRSSPSNHARGEALSWQAGVSMRSIRRISEGYCLPEYNAPAYTILSTKPSLLRDSAGNIRSEWTRLREGLS